MNVILAKSAGFCFGVKRAVEKVYKEAQKSSVPVYTFGPIIHNEEVVADLERKGVHAVTDMEELKSLPKGIVIIRSHGISREGKEQIMALGFDLIDATCPFVLKIHKIVEDYSKKGYHILIIGNDSHPEVEGIKGWVLSDKITVLSSKEEAENLKVPIDEKICIVSQTTFNYNKFQELVEIIHKKGYDIIVLNTICNATQERQEEAAKIARKVDAMIVIGGRHSSNTQKLFEICKKECANTYYIQTLDDLDIKQLCSIDNVGITAGASTPNKIIEEVQEKCQK